MNNIYLGAPAIEQIDGYKTSHKDQYPENTVKIYCNFTPRKSRVKGVDAVVMFGITYFIKNFLIEHYDATFFTQPKAAVVKALKRRLDNYLGPNSLTYDHFEALHDLGYLPVTIKAIAEGSLVNIGVPVMTITNELPEYFWLPNFLETILSCELWPMCTSATTAFNYRLIFDKFALETVGNTEFSSTFQAHDFSFRGLIGRHAAAMSGAAHLACFVGTDTIPAIDLLEWYYNCDSDKELIGASIPATEHSVMCMGMKDGELETFRRLICDVHPSGFVGIVSDTWNLWNVVTPKPEGILSRLKLEVLAREGRVVIRPDSGDPVKIITGYKSGETYEVNGKFYRIEDITFPLSGHNVPVTIGSSAKALSEEERKGVVECLWEIFGGIINGLGYKELDTHIGCIYGDSITLERASIICQRLKDKGFASTNWVAGVGSYSYQYVTRDTFGFAMKATYGELAHYIAEKREDAADVVYGTLDSGEEVILDLPFEEIDENTFVVESREIFKDPITDDGTKKSAKGLMVVYKDENGDYFKQDQVDYDTEAQGELEIVFENGNIVVDPTLAEIRARINENVLRKLGV